MNNKYNYIFNNYKRLKNGRSYYLARAKSTRRRGALLPSPVEAQLPLPLRRHVPHRHSNPALRPPPSCKFSLILADICQFDFLLAIDDADGRVYGLGEQRRSEACQVRELSKKKPTYAAYAKYQGEIDKRHYCPYI